MASTARLVWVDRARGAAILLVVLHHSVLCTVSLGLNGDRWRVLDGLLAGMRMPLFFFVSGVLAARALQRPWRELLRGKVANLVWLYVVWLLLATVLLTLVPYPRTREVEADPLGAWRGALHAFDLPTSSLWYLYALALFTVGGRLLRRVPTVPLLVAAAVVSTALVTVDALATDNYTWSAVGSLFPFFLAGSRLTDLLRDHLHRVPLPVGAAALVASPAVVVASWSLPEGFPRPGLHLAVGALAVLGGVVVAGRLPDVAPVRLLERLGGLTLPVYVLHELFITLVALLWLRGLAADRAPLETPLAPLLPLALAAVAAAASLGLHRLLRGVPGLFELPEALRPQGTRRRREAASAG
ncbi:acyltransferase [Pseudokineococcus marinus]|uniref:Acyltransferase n=1 Tax=Pseudokineococcus marinus TaxID=351215 RepID=A0A849BKL3_9ACTN|nr:acyltransferase [Pseudokineococcus marinus]NNH21885.1 acyltransferase [Pseudokineococcus marinus]